MLNPPTGITASEYWEAIKAGNPIHAYMSFASNGGTLTDEHFDLSGGIVIEDIINPDTDLVFGRAVMKQLTAHIIVSDYTNTIKWEQPVSLYIGVEINGTTEYVFIDKFYGERPQRMDTLKSVEFVAYDGMSKFNRLAKGFTTDPYRNITLKEICYLLCSFVGISAPTSYPNDAIWDKVYATLPLNTDGYTCRDILAMIAEAAGRYAKVHNDRLKFVWYEDHSDDVTIDEDEQFAIEREDTVGMTWNEFDLYTWDEAEEFIWDDIEGEEYVHGINAMRVRQSRMGIEVDYPVYSPPPTENVYLIVDNPFIQFSNIQSDITTYIKPLYDRINSLKFQLPMRVEYIGNWLIESGDVVKVKTNGRIFSIPIFVKTMVWRGRATVDAIEVTGNHDREPIAREVQDQIFNSSIIRLFVDDLHSEIETELDDYYARQSGIEINTNGVEIYGNKYVTIEATDNKQWIFDEYGLRYRNTNTGVIYLQFGDEHRTEWDTEAGISNLKTSTSDQHGRLCFWATDRTGGYQSAYTGSIVFECDNQYGVASFYPYRLYEYNTPSCNLGKPMEVNSTKGWFAQAYLTHVHTYEIIGVQNYIRFKPVDNALSQTELRMGVETAGFTIQSFNGDTVIKTRIYNGEFVSVSSRAKKHNIKTLASVGNVIDKLEPVSFVYNDDVEENTKFGLIYEDTVGVLPEICVESTSDDGGTSYGINYTDLIPVLLKEIKDLRVRVAELERG